VLEIRGQYAYGFLHAETGVHRLVRISPFDSASRRHTSFASVFVYPVVNEEINIEISRRGSEDRRLSRVGAGGQHVNKTSSRCASHTFRQHCCRVAAATLAIKNKAQAMKMLKNKLYQPK
jgi:peptide chain release factor 2